MLMRLLLLALLGVGVFCNQDHVAHAQATWTHRDLYPQNSDLNSIAAFPNGLAVCVGANGVIERSIDTGKTWTIQEMRNLTFTAVTSFDSKNFVAVSREGKAITSRDSGVSWVLYDIFGSPAANSISAVDSSSFFVVGDGGYIERTTDFGNHWSIFPGTTSGNLNAVLAIDIHHLIICGDSGIIQRSENGGYNWEPDTIGITSSLHQLTLTPDGRVFAYGDLWVIVTSADSGKTWQKIILDSTSPSKYPSAIVRNIVFFNRTRGFAFAAQDPLTLLNDYVTEDGGLTWQILHIIDDADDDHSAVAVDTLRAIKVGQYGGIYLTSNQGRSWEEVNKINSVNYTHLIFSSPSKGFVTSHSGIDEVEISTDAGLNWNNVYAAPSIVSGMVFPNAALGFAYGDDFVARTVDSGFSWSTETSASFGSVISMSFSSPANGVLLTSAQAILSTYDSGSSWNPLPRTPVSQTAFEAGTLLGEDTILVLCSTAVFRSTNHGADWDSTTLPCSGKSIRFAGSDRGWIVGSVPISGFPTGSVILSTSDAGATWSQQLIDSSHHLGGLSDVAIEDSSNAIAADFINSAYNPPVFETNNVGVTWSLDTMQGISINSDQFVGVAYPAVNTAYLLTRDGYLFIGTFASAGVQTQTDLSSQVVVYPNPSSRSITITSIVTGPFIILDPLGRSYDVEQNGNTIDVSALPSGVYFINDGRSRAKFIKE